MGSPPQSTKKTAGQKEKLDQEISCKSCYKRAKCKKLCPEMEERLPPIELKDESGTDRTLSFASNMNPSAGEDLQHPDRFESNEDYLSSMAEKNGTLAEVQDEGEPTNEELESFLTKYVPRVLPKKAQAPERAMLRAFLRGAKWKEIAANYGTSEQNVRMKTIRLMKKLGKHVLAEMGKDARCEFDKAGECMRWIFHMAKMGWNEKK